MLLSGFEKRIYSSILGIIFCVGIISFSCYKIWHNIFWYDDLYAQLHEHHIKDYRLLFIWVQGGVSPHVRPIGGNAANNAQWVMHTESFLREAAYRFEHNDNAPFVHVEVVVDPPTYALHKLLFDRWREQYGEHILITPVSVVGEKYPLISKHLQQCTSGIPALCSDIIRLFYLKNSCDMNVYMDIDLFINAHREGFKKDSAHTYGLAGQDYTLHQSYFIGDRKNEIVNNDFLVDRHYQEWDKLHQDGYKQLALYDKPMEFLYLRYKWINDPMVYDSVLQEKHAWYKKNRTINFHPINSVLHIVGPVFWLKQNECGRVENYKIPNMPNASSWIAGPLHLKSVDGYMTYDILHKNMGDDVAEHAMLLTFMAHDYQLLKAYNIPWKCKLAYKIRTHWQQLPADTQEKLKKVLLTPMYWAEAIADDVEKECSS